MKVVAIALVALTARAVLSAPEAQETPKASETYTVECSFSNPAYSGYCRVSEKVPRKMSPAAACQSILSCLNNSQCIKTYCNATTIRGGWRVVSSKRQAAAHGDHSAMAAATGVARADGGKGPREQRIIPLGKMEGDVEILYGDPERDGEPFVMRVHELPGSIVPPHSHPVDEHITVVSGSWFFALGQEFDRKALTEIKAGGYAFAPKGSWMFGYCPDGAIVQVHGVGPFRIHWRGGLHTLNDADSSSVFRFARGTSVSDSRRAGKIVEGYASGTIIQYEIVEKSGAHFMASEEDLRPQ